VLIISKSDGEVQTNRGVESLQLDDDAAHVDAEQNADRRGNDYISSTSFFIAQKTANRPGEVRDNFERNRIQTFQDDSE